MVHGPTGGDGLSRALSGLFVWEAREDVTCDKWISGVEHGIIFILLAHFVHSMLIADFVWSLDFVTCGWVTALFGMYVTTSFQAAYNRD